MCFLMNLFNKIIKKRKKKKQNVINLNFTNQLVNALQYCVSL